MLDERTSKVILGAEALLLALPLTLWLPEAYLHRDEGTRYAAIAVALAAGAGLASFWWLAMVFWRRGALGLRTAPALVWVLAGLCAGASIAAGAFLWLDVDENLQERMAPLVFGIPLLIPFTHLLVERQMRVSSALQHAVQLRDLNNPEAVREILLGIHFTERYVNLSRRFAYPLEKAIKKLEIDVAEKIILRLGYPVEYHKGDQFFQVVLRGPPFKVQLNLVLKYGVAELIFSVYQDNVYVPSLSGPWGKIVEDAGLSPTRIRPPIFRNYEDLTQLLVGIFSIMEDLKKKLLGHNVDYKGELAADAVSGKGVAQEPKTPLLAKVDQLLIELDNRQGEYAEFFRTASYELKYPDTIGEAVERLRSCYSMTQYGTFSSAEVKLLEEIISLCSDLQFVTKKEI